MCEAFTWAIHQCTSYESELASDWMFTWLISKGLSLPLVVQGTNEWERAPPRVRVRYMNERNSEWARVCVHVHTSMVCERKRERLRKRGEEGLSGLERDREHLGGGGGWWGARASERGLRSRQHISGRERAYINLLQGGIFVNVVAFKKSWLCGRRVKQSLLFDAGPSPCCGGSLWSDGDGDSGGVGVGSPGSGHTRSLVSSLQNSLIFADAQGTCQLVRWWVEGHSHQASSSDPSQGVTFLLESWSRDAGELLQGCS